MGALDNFTDGIKNAGRAFVEGAKEGLTDRGGSSNSPSLLVFPSDLALSERPYIRFKCESYEGSVSLKTVHLPCPAGISFSDAGSYGVIDVGLIAPILKAANALTSGQSPQDLAKEVGTAFGAEVKNGGVTGAAILASRAIGLEKVATGIEFANKSIMNPRTNGAFSGNTMRNFQFNFKMIGRSESEVQMIDKIQNLFREQIYAEKFNGGSSFMLKYPNQWTITFLHPKTHKELEYMPKIYTCYLQTATTTVNSTSNTFRRHDMSPYEIDISLQFQETKILTRDEIVALEKHGTRINEMDEDIKELTDKTAGMIKKGYDAGVAKFGTPRDENAPPTPDQF